MYNIEINVFEDGFFVIVECVFSMTNWSLSFLPLNMTGRWEFMKNLKKKFKNAK